MEGFFILKGLRQKIIDLFKLEAAPLSFVFYLLSLLR